MVNRKVYLGNFNNDKKKELIHTSIENLKNNKGNEFYYILPNGELLRQYRKQFIDRVQHAFEINLFTFDDIVTKVVEDDYIHVIDNPTKNLILREVLNSLSEEGVLDYYKDFTDMTGFINSLNDIIGDIKRSLVYPEDYTSSCPKKPFYQEIGLIYSAYENKLAELNVSDREGSYFKAVELIKSKNFLKDVKTIIIDEFYNFRPIELAILDQLIKSDIDIIINMPFLSESKSIILEETLDLLKDLGFEIEYLEDSTRNTFEDLGRYLFSGKEDLFEVNENIKIINGATPYLELRKIFEEIKKYNKEGVDLNNIGLILTNPSYQEALHKISNMEGIPISINKASPLKTMPISRDLLNILDNRMENYSKQALINRVKSDYYMICPEDSRDLYEIILRKLDFQNADDLMAIFESNERLNISIEDMDHLKELIQTIESEYQEIKLTDTISNYNKNIKSILEDYKLQDDILRRYKDTKDELLFLRDMRTLNKIETVLEKMSYLNIFKDDISLEDYYYLLIDYFEEETVMEVQGNIKGVHILNPTNSRGSVKDIIFITGLAQASYPSIDNSNYFINDYNLKDLRAMGIDVKNYKERLSNEGLKFASIVASSRNKLYLSYSSGYDQGTIKSIFLDEVLSLLKKDDDNKVNIKETKVNLDYLVKATIDDVTNYDDLTKHLLQSYFKGSIDDFHIFEKYKQAFPGKLHSINSKILSEVNRYQDIYDEYRGVLEGESILQDVAMNKPKSYSISYLESYARCPYFFMLNNLFKVEEMEREYQEYRPIDIGNLYHDVLSSYYKIYIDDIEEKMRGRGDFSFDDTLDTLKYLISKSADEIGLKKDLNRDILALEMASKWLINFLEKDIDKIIKDKRLPYEFESDFAFHIEINDTKIPMIGRIDRIDKYLDKEDYLAIDYKSSTYGLRNTDHMRSGLSLQLPLYILSQEDKHMIGGAYGIIKDGDTKVSMALNPHLKLRGRSKANLSQDEWDDLMDLTKENIYKFIEDIDKGNFQVNPLECSAYCIYKDICRYEAVVEVDQ